MISTILSLWLAAAAATPAPAEETRTVAFELREGERLIGTPALQVRLGEPASVSVGGPSGYALSLVVERAGPSGSYLVRSGLYRPADGGWRLVAAPSLMVAQGEQARAVISRSPEPAYGLGVTVR